MKTTQILLASLFALFLTFNVTAQEAATDNNVDAAKRGDVQKLMEISGSGKIGVQVMDQMMASFRRSMPQVPTDFWDELSKEISGDELVGMIVPIYEKRFTHDEIKQLIAFYESPIGKKLVQEQPGIVQESMAVGQAWGQKLGQRVIEKLKAREVPKQAEPQEL